MSSYSHVVYLELETVARKDILEARKNNVDRSFQR